MLNHLINDPACFKNANPSCIDNFYNYKNTLFFNSSTVETGIYDHHSLICTRLCSTFCKGLPNFIYHSCYNNYNKEEFENVLKQRLVSSSSFENWQNCKRNICSNVLMSTKNAFFGNLNITEITDYRQFWKK